MKTNRNINQEEWTALAKKYFGNDGADDEKALTNELEAIDTTDLAEIEKIAKQIDLHYKLKRFNSSTAFNQVKSQLDADQKKIVFFKEKRQLLQIAAAIILAMLIGSVWYYTDPMQLINPTSSELSIDDYGISKVELPDGTLVTLNRDSKIDYPDKFSKDKREVYIEGEAFFEVAPNPNKPFIIYAGDARIRVVGTSFNVNAYPGNEQVEVVVETGKVQVFRGEEKPVPESKLILDPGDKGIYVNASKELLKMHNQDPNFLAWKTRHLIFRDTSLKEVISQLSKLYEIEIKTSDAGLYELQYTGHFENQSIDFILEVIALTLEIEVDKQNECFLLSKVS